VPDASRESVVITDQQVRFFKAFGYQVFPGLLADCIDEIIEAFEEVWRQRGKGHNSQPHDGSERSCIVPFPDQHPRLCELFDDPRISAVAAALMGDAYNLMPSDGNYYAGDTQWHSDGADTDILHVKFAFYLDPLTRDTGCVRVIPGSHRFGDQFANTLSEDIRKSDEHWGIDGSQVPAQAVATQPGDVVVFDHKTKHASFGGSGWRRMFTMNMCQRYPEDRVQELRDYLEGIVRFWVDRAYGPIMMETAGPERMRHLEQVMANDDHIAELSRKAREKMEEPSRG